MVSGRVKPFILNKLCFLFLNHNDNRNYNELTSLQNLILNNVYFTL